jgi:chromosome segregation ATPase
MLLKLLTIIFALSLLSNALFYALYKHERKAHFKTMQTLTQCQSDLKTTSQQLSEYAQKYESLKKLCELDKKRLEAKYSRLLKTAAKPTPYITIPQTNDECQALKEMLDEASKHFIN